MICFLFLFAGTIAVKLQYYLCFSFLSARIALEVKNLDFHARVINGKDIFIETWSGLQVKFGAHNWGLEIFVPSTSHQRILQMRRSLNSKCSEYLLAAQIVSSHHLRTPPTAPSLVATRACQITRDNIQHRHKIQPPR